MPNSLGTDVYTLGTDAFSLRTDAYCIGTDAISLGTNTHSLGTSLYATGTDAHSLSTAAPSGRAANSAVCKYCCQYHGRWHKACEASKEEKHNGKKRHRSA